MLVVKEGTQRFRSSEILENIQNGESLGKSETVTQSLYFDSYKEHVVGPRNWKALIQNGHCATTYAYGYKMAYSHSPANLFAFSIPKNPLFNPRTDTYRTGDIYRLQGTFSSTPSNTASLEEAETKARTSYFQRCHETMTRFQGGVFAGEIRETLRMIRKPAQALRNGVSAYLNHVTKRVNRAKTAKAISDAVTGTWLEYNFGWRPLFGDIDAGIRALVDLNRTQRLFQRVDATGRSQRLSQVQGFSNTGASAVGVRRRIVRLDEISVSYYGNVFCTRQGPDAQYLFGATWGDFLPTVWELIPYSFLVDYFTNIGEVISSWSYQGTRTAWTSRTIRSSVKVYPEGACRLPFPSNAFFDRTSGGSLGSALLEYTEFTRDPSVSVDIPSLELRIPGVGSLKWANIGALTAQYINARQTIAYRRRNVR